MKVLYDHQIFLLQNYGGISRYFFELMNCYNNDKDIDFKLALKYSDNYYIENATFSNHNNYYKNFKLQNKFNYKFYNLANILNSKKEISKGNFDVFHPTYYEPYFLNKIGNKPFVLTIHDMIHEIFTEQFAEDKTAQYKRLLAQKATKIIAVSENTKKDIIKYYGIDENKIKVIYHGNSFKADAENAKSAKNTIKMELPEKYILFVGVRRGYKNFKGFVEAVTPLLQKDDNLKLICVGGGSFDNTEKELLASLNISNKTLQYSIDDSTLSEFYKNALAFIYPSLYEGFGIPILEAFTCGCPVILSNSSCFPEVAEDSAVYFDACDEISMRNTIEKVIYDNSLRDNLIQKGFDQVKKFSWEKTAQATKALYESV